MKKNIVFALALLLPLLSACNREQTAGGNVPDENGLIRAEFSFKAERPRNIAVRATEALPNKDGGIQMTIDNAPATREGSLATDQEDAIHNVWALQFDGDGKFLRRELVTNPQQTVDDAGIRYRVKVRLYIQDDCTVYFVANRPGIDWQSSLIAGQTTLDEFKNSTLGMNTESDVIVDDAIPMAGYYEGPVPNTVNTVVDMTRLVAKIVFTMNYASTLTDNSTLNISSVQLVNVPVIARYHNGALDDPHWRYPDATEPDILSKLTDYTAITKSGGFAANTDHTFTWYVPENRRGENPSVGRQQDKWKGNDPSIEECGYSTSMRIVMKGWYLKYRVSVRSLNSDPGISTPKGPTDPGGNPGRPPLGANDIKINLHPGRNITTDYNVIRNSIYNIRANIPSIKDDDPRVELNPVVTYRYYYEDPDVDGAMLFLASEQVTTLAVGAAIPKDQTVLDAKKSLIPDNGHTYMDGTTTSTATVVSSDDSQNIIDIYYNRVSNGPYYVTVSWILKGSAFDQEVAGPFSKGDTFKPMDYVMRHGFNYNGANLMQTVTQGASTYSTSWDDLEVNEDLTCTLYYANPV